MPAAGLDVDGFAVDLSDDERALQRLYGAWDGFDPTGAAEVLADGGFPWWVCGGWAIEAFTGIARDHSDIDVGMFRRDLAALRAHVAGSLHVWAAGPGGLCPLDDARMEMPAEADQVWLRSHALAPWRADVLLSPDDDGRWVSRRDRSHVADLDVVTWTRDGIRFLRPEIVLVFKAKQARPKDELDLEATLPLLDDPTRAWLADAVGRLHPGHPWVVRIERAGPAGGSAGDAAEPAHPTVE